MDPFESLLDETKVSSKEKTKRKTYTMTVDIANTINDNMVKSINALGDNKQYIFLVGDLRRGEIPTELEYLSIIKLNLIAVILQLPGSVNMSSDTPKIEYQHSSGLKVLFRYCEPSKLPFQMFNKTGPRTFVNSVTKLLEKKGYTLTKDDLQSDNKSVNIRSEDDLIAFIKKTLEISCDLSPPHRNSDIFKKSSSKKK